MHFAAIAPPFPSHLRSFEAIADRLAARGHRVTLVHHADAGRLIRGNALRFHALEAVTQPPGSVTAMLVRAARPGGLFGVLRTVRDMARATDMLCREAPAILESIGADAVIADEMEAAGGLVAEHMDLPFVSVANAVSVRREPLVPSSFLPFDFDPTPKGEHRNRGAERIGDLLMNEHSKMIARHAHAFGLQPKTRLQDCLSPYAEVSQLVKSLDFPRSHLPNTFHHVGPIRSPRLAEPALDLPVEAGRPFVFASFGTLQGSRFQLFRKVAKACRELEYQLLVAHCGGLRPREAKRLGATWVTDFAPQRAALARADLLVTHAGVNTVLDALATDVPMLALPMAFDQPGMAARVIHAGVGLRASCRFATTRCIRSALERLTHDDRYRRRAAQIGDDVREAGGAVRAAEIIERVAQTGRPVAAC
jgi:zeaxanthin glucosyltransferase